VSILLADGFSAGTVMAGLIGGASGGFIATLLQIAHERSENFRSRCVQAADDFSTALSRALLALNDAYALFKKGAFADTSEPLELARKSMDEAHSHLARVELLFGDESAAGDAAHDAIIHLRTAFDILAPATGADPLTGYVEAYDEAHVCQLRFNRAAREQIRPWWSWRRRRN
jgi:hypothetical protein